MLSLFKLINMFNLQLIFQELDEIQTYPIEVIPGLLFLGNWRQGNAAYIQKDLKVRGHVNCCPTEGTL